MFILILLNFTLVAVSLVEGKFLAEGVHDSSPSSKLCFEEVPSPFSVDTLPLFSVSTNPDQWPWNEESSHCPLNIPELVLKHAEAIFQRPSEEEKLRALELGSGSFPHLFPLTQPAIDFADRHQRPDLWERYT